MEWAITSLAASLVATALLLRPVLALLWGRRATEEVRKLLEAMERNEEIVRELKEVDECPWCGCRLTTSPALDVEMEVG